MQHFSVTAALRAAMQCVGRPVRYDATSYAVFYHEPGETASRQMQADSYTKAVSRMTGCKAEIAIQILAEQWGYDLDTALLLVWQELSNHRKWQRAVSIVHEAMTSQE